VCNLPPTAQYPRLPANSPWASDPVPAEEPLGLDVNVLEAVGTAAEIERSLALVGPEAPASAHQSADVVETLPDPPPTTQKKETTVKSETVRDPVSGDSVTFVGDDAAHVALSHLEVAARHSMTIKELYRMVRVAILGPAALDDDFDPFAQPLSEAERDRDLLKLSLPPEEALAIWKRSRDDLRRVVDATTDPAKRAQLEKFLTEREAAMANLIGEA
jgi:hypothetical protein